MSKTRTYQDRSAYLIKAVSKRRQKIKSMAVEMMGGECQFCGYSSYLGALEFHHIGPEKKKFGLSKDGITRSWERVKNELKNCILVCSNCHREIHGGLITVDKKEKAGK